MGLTENKIESSLRLLNCSGRSFVAIAKNLGVAISDGPFSQGVRHGFDVTLAARLLEVLRRMKSLADSVAVPICWAVTERIVTALTIQQVQKIAAELDDHRLDGVAEKMLGAS